MGQAVWKVEYLQCHLHFNSGFASVACWSFAILYRFMTWTSSGFMNKCMRIIIPIIRSLMIDSWHVLRVGSWINVCVFVFPLQETLNKKQSWLEKSATGGWKKRDRPRKKRQWIRRQWIKRWWIKRQWIKRQWIKRLFERHLLLIFKSPSLHSFSVVLRKFYVDKIKEKLMC